MNLIIAILCLMAAISLSYLFWKIDIWLCKKFLPIPSQDCTWGKFMLIALAYYLAATFVVMLPSMTILLGLNVLAMSPETPSKVVHIVSGLCFFVLFFGLIGRPRYVQNSSEADLQRILKSTLLATNSDDDAKKEVHS